MLWVFYAAGKLNGMQLETAGMAPRPKSPQPKVYNLNIRLNAAQMDLLTKASQSAQSEDLDRFTVSSWARAVLVAEARKVLRRAQDQN
jgi:uncharacterized protein (DUF1778 family)